jgi:hypothetical protein
MKPDHAQLETKRSVPATALQFLSGPCEFGQADAVGGKTPVKLTARSGEPINHWYWGPTVHDLAGMQLHKDRIPLDYAHYDQEVIGYADKFDASSGDLVVDGALVPFGSEDRASEVIFKAQNGVPYESSIFFADPVIEDVPAGKSTQVNGKQMAGPLTVFRQWNLRGIAICPYGADMNTPVQLAAGDQVQVRVFQHKENAMADEQKPVETEDVKPADETPPAVKTEEQPATEPAKPAEESPAQPVTQQSAKTGKDFLESFGQQGAVWFVEGKTWDEAQKLHTAALEAKVADLEAKLAGVKFGQSDPVSFSPADDDPQAQRKAALASRLGDNVARFAAGIQLPEPSKN